jgi:alkylhydroperoxidase family enzyme
MRLLLIRGSNETADHVLGAFPDATNVNLYARHQPRWTHRLRLPGAADLSELLPLLRRVIALRVSRELDAALALDFHQQPCPTSENGVIRTPTGQLVYTVKYENRSAEKVRSAGRALCTSLTDVVLTHPWFSTADLVLPVPGHDPERVAASIRIGATIARSTGKELGSVTCRHRGYRRPAKDMTRAERAQLLDEYSIDQDLAGRTILVVDDLYHSGSTMTGVARAARKAGATTVLGLSGTRNLRR